MAHARDYQSLDATKKEIRLLRLLPAQNWQDEVVINLKTVSFLDAELISFEALSYVWGSPHDPGTILVHETGAVIPATRNLLEALRYLRSDSNAQNIWMWIDAVCVNQQDLAERSEQVRYMASIYTRATKVIAWLGPHDHDSNLAFDCLENISNHVTYDIVPGVAPKLHAKTSDLSWVDDQRSSINNEVQSAAIIRFFQRSWFSRLWIRQEILLGFDRAVMRCGDRTIPWLNLRSAVGYIYRKGHGSFELNQWAREESYGYIYFLRNDLNVGLPQLLRNGRAAKCSDQRDRVYATLSLSSVNYGIVPDYTKSVAQVYAEAALSDIRRHESLTILTHVGAQSEILAASGLPTWAPDWSTSVQAAPLSPLWLGLSDRFLHLQHDRGVLRIQGRMAGKIKEISPWPNKHESDMETTKSAMKTMIFDSVAKAIREGDDGVLRQLCRVLCSNRFSDSLPAWDFYPSHAAAESAVLATLHARETPQDKYQSWRFWAAIRKNCRGRALAQGSDSRLGLVPAHARVGDVFATLIACHPAMMLRPAPNNAFTVVGPAFYDGVMEGEALLGPLPHTHESCMVGDYSSEHVMFRRIETGQVEHDPRIPEKYVAEMSCDRRIYDLEALGRDRVIKLDLINLI
ncbi:unnamed protein product [Zymoseptoria tritici ST99CH_3D7]|uniref:Heterokaryon incompatibility domain-containing protein n=1 Tax=Zymoseptoria tritici (strain ST99CH_3D7) TaxID=1276538 RepID=A0A1X7S2U7_ZYMT9|nr:unnamed protein product [Zymoseptoria tritici ST99CH_3D7]